MPKIADGRYINRLESVIETYRYNDPRISTGIKDVYDAKGNIDYNIVQEIPITQYVHFLEISYERYDTNDQFVDKIGPIKHELPPVDAKEDPRAARDQLTAKC